MLQALKNEIPEDISKVDCRVGQRVFCRAPSVRRRRRTMSQGAHKILRPIMDEGYNTRDRCEYSSNQRRFLRTMIDVNTSKCVCIIIPSSNQKLIMKYFYNGVPWRRFFLHYLLDMNKTLTNEVFHGPS